MKARRPFTLIELLVVIAIIAILAGLLLPAIGNAKQRAKVTQAKSQIKALQIAIRQYETTYGYLPFAGTESVLSIADYTNLINDLSCSVAGRSNPRGIVFLEVQTAGVYEDPWKTAVAGAHNFQVVLNTNYDTNIPITAGPYAPVFGQVAIWSKGPKGDDSNGKGPQQGAGFDDINSWDN